jgi:hypothetical protein
LLDLYKFGHGAHANNRRKLRELVVPSDLCR